jgi:hypothetical protein
MGLILLQTILLPSPQLQLTKEQAQEQTSKKPSFEMYNNTIVTKDGKPLH